MAQDDAERSWFDRAMNWVGERTSINDYLEQRAVDERNAERMARAQVRDSFPTYEDYRGVHPERPEDWVQRQYHRDLNQRTATEVARTRPEEDAVGFLARHVGTVSAMGQAGDQMQENLPQRRQRIAAGNGSGADYQAIADAEERQRRERARTYGEAAWDAVAHVPAMAAEFFVGGALVGGALKAIGVGSKVGLVGALTQSRLVQHVANSGGIATLMPSMYLHDAIDNNQQAGRDPMNWRGFPAPMLAATVQTAILGSIGGQASKGIDKLMQPGIASTLTKLGVAGPLGLVESQIGDLATYFAGMKTGYGPVQDIFEHGDWKPALSSALTFAAFAALHSGRHGTPEDGQRVGEHVLDKFAADMDTLSRHGVPPKEAAEHLLNQMASEHMGGDANQASLSTLARPAESGNLPPEMYAQRAASQMEGRGGTSLSDLAGRAESRPDQAPQQAPTPEPPGTLRPEAIPAKADPVERAASIFQEIFPNTRPSGDGLAADVGGRTVYLTHNEATNALRLDFEYAQAGKSGVPKELQKGSTDLARGIRSLVEQVHETGLPIEYLATDASRQAEGAPKRARSDIYAKALEKAGYELVSGPGTKNPGDGITYRWEPRQTAPEAPAAAPAPQGAETSVQAGANVQAQAPEPAASPRAAEPIQQRPEVLQQAVQALRSTGFGAKEAKRKVMEAAAAAEKPFGTVQEAVQAAMKGPVEQKPASYPQEAGMVKPAAAEERAPASWESLYEKAKVGDQASREEINQRAGLAANEARVYWERHDPSAPSYESIAGKLGQTRQAAHAAEGRARAKIEEAFGLESGAVHPTAEAITQSAGERQQQLESQATMVEPTEGRGRAKVTPEERAQNRDVAKFWVETKAGKDRSGFYEEMAGIVEKAARVGKDPVKALHQAYPDLQEWQIDHQTMQEMVKSVKEEANAIRAATRGGDTQPEIAASLRSAQESGGASAADRGAGDEAPATPIPPDRGGSEGAVPNESAAQPGVEPAPAGRVARAVHEAATALPPPKSQGQAKLTEATVRDVADPQFGPIGPEAREWLRTGWQALSDYFAEAGGAIAPRLQRLSEAATNQLARFISAPDFAKRATSYYIDHILGRDVTPERAKEIGAAYLELRFRTMKTGKSLVGAEPLKTEADYQRIVTSPEFQEVRQKYRQDFAPLLDEYYRKAEGMPEAEPIMAATQMPGEPIHAIALHSGETSASAMVAGQGRGNLNAPKQQKLGFARNFKGTAEAYETDMRKIIEHSLVKAAPVAEKAELYRSLVKEGIAQWIKPGTQIEGYKNLPNVTPPKGTQANEGKTWLAVKEDAYKELRRALGPDEPWAKIPGADIMTRVGLASLVEGLTHTKNILTNIFKPGVSPVELVRNVKAVWNEDPAIQRQLLDMAREGMVKPAGFESGPSMLIQKPMEYLGHLLDVVDSAQRVTMKQAYEKMTPEGRTQGTQSEMRDFVNQVGQYNKKAQPALISWLRDTGIGPFATAGANYTVQGIKHLFMMPGITAKSAEGQMHNRGEMLLRIGAVLAVVPVVNFLRWGRADGDENTPLGSIKIGTSETGKTTYFDLASFTGLPRGARTLGLTALADGWRQGRSATEIGNRAAHDVGGALVHPMMGPMAQAVHTVATGENAVGSPMVHQGSSITDRLGAAAINANPVLAQAFGGNPQQERTATERAWGVLGPVGLKYGDGVAVTDFYHRLHELQDQQRSAGQRGGQFKSEDELATLQAYARHVNKLREVLQGRSQRMGYAGAPADHDYQAYLRRELASLATSAMREARQVRR